MFRCSTIAKFILLFLCNIWAQNVLQKGKDLFYLKKAPSQCNFSYVDEFIYDIDLVTDEKECVRGHCTFELGGLYNRLPPKKGCLESSFIDVGLKYNEKNFIPLCDFVKYSKSSNTKKSGTLSFLHEGLCLYKAVNKINFVKNEYKYRFGIMKIIKDSTNSFILKNRKGAYCNQGECEMDIVFHSCDANVCRFSIAQQGFLFDSSSKINIIPLCDFVKIDLSFDLETMSLGSISATHSGTCDLRIRNKKINHVISIDLPAKVIDLPKSSKTWIEE